ncbi:hypothetical protein F53441_1394 [Fusarium austroafricanum]|uniref:Uncharacterized protein n=1 Tax=Fusarium austroafricanum TaxID=2364996 RepID=A0A8H4KS60_9HYPO|nr:hypothetical protein F53441_1394 [Fusarium austroafricanum]
MVERKFQLKDDYVFNRTYHGIPIPQKWQAWETAHFFHVKSIIENPDVGAQLISNGCSNGDPDLLNCTATCSNATLMHTSSENLWNCMTLATLGVLVGQGNDTIHKESEKKMDDKFHFGTAEDFDELKALDKVRECAWASCSDSKDGSCASSFRQFYYNTVSPDNIAEFGSAMAGPYCEDASVGTVPDVTGSGSFFQRDNEFREMCEQRQIKIARSQFADGSSSALAELQDYQDFFTSLMSIIAITTFSQDSTTVLANKSTLFSWILDHRISQGLITAGVYPVLLAQLLMIRTGKRRVYTPFVVALSWILMAVATELQHFNENALEERLRHLPGIEACGGMPGPMSFCQGVKDKDDHEPFSVTLAHRFVAHGVALFLVIDWIVHFVKHSGDKLKSIQIGQQGQSLFLSTETKAAKLFLSVFWTCVEILLVIMTLIGLLGSEKHMQQQAKLD